MNTRHTPGPWQTWENGDGEYGIERNGDSLGTMEGQNAKANARLIAAAPDLLEAARSMIDWQDTPAHVRGDFRPIQKALRQAIAKAERK